MKNLFTTQVVLVATAVILTIRVQATQAGVHEVEVRDLSFFPSEVNTSPGDTVRWIWQSGSHTVTSGTPCTHDGVHFDESVSSINQVFEFVVPDDISEIPYFCRPHCGFGMTGMINVARPPVEFMITLDGFQENEPVVTPATGSGTATFDPSTNELSWIIEFQGLKANETAAHFHGPALPCDNVGTQITLSSGSPKIGSQIITEQQAEDLLAGLWYVNVHSSAHTGGEIRGRVAPVPLENPVPELIGIGDIHVRLETVAGGLTAPNWGASAPEDPDRLFISDQDGILWAIPTSNAEVMVSEVGSNVFLDVSARLVSLGVGGPGSFDERGLLGFAFHPDYATNGKLYTYTSEPVSGPADFSTIPVDAAPNHQSVVLEWTVPNPSDPESVVDPKSVRELLRIDQPQFNHNAGAMTFGFDGMLYITLGDGGGRDDRDDGMSLGVPLVGHGCDGNGADKTTILGSIIRIDPDGTNSANGQYGVPQDNPFVGQEGLDEIYAYGFRNPFRISFDSLTGDLYAADVGQNDIEEINIVSAGGHYGWRLKEGSFGFIFNGNQPGYVTDHPLEHPAGLIDPIAQYDHDDGIAVVGGFVYRGLRIRPLQGRYVFGEFAQTFSNDGRLFYLDQSDAIREFPLIDQKEFAFSLLGMGQDGHGEIYALVNETGTPFGTSGKVLRIETLPGDVDADGDLDLTNYAEFSTCMNGPHAAASKECAPMDLDENGDVSLRDLSFFQIEFRP